MKKNLILAAPTAKIQIGNKASIELDTASTQGKKTVKIQIVTENDSFTKEIENVVEEIQDELKGVKSNDNNNGFWESQVEIEKLKSKNPVDIIGVFIPIVAILAVFGFLAFSNFQRRKWKEALLNKGYSLEDINKEDNMKNKLTGSSERLDRYEKNKTLKYALVFGSLGIAMLLGTVTDSAGYFFGSLMLLLGGGFWYYHQQIK